MSHSAPTVSGIQIDDPEAGSTWIVALASVIILAALLVATCVFYFHFETTEVVEKVIDEPNAWALGLKNEQMSQLSSYQKYTATAPDGSTVTKIRIPVSKAMELIIADAGKPIAQQSAPTVTGASSK